MRPIGLLIIATAFAIPAMLFVEQALGRDQTALFSQYLGVCALIAMSFCQIFATRMSGLELIFGGLDRIYVLHKWLGIVAMMLIVLHDTIDAEMDGLGRETLLSELGETLGEISLYGLLVLVTLSIATFVPYDLWRYTHKLMGAFFAAGAAHFMLIQKPFALGDVLGLYVVGFCVTGILAYLYTLLPIGLLKGWRKYEVSHLQPTGGALAVTLRPVSGQGIRHKAGQFAFLQFDATGATEVHPFTISQSAKDDRSLRFTIKALGDYTAGLPEVLEVGTPARVSGPFGHFRSNVGRQPQVWIASGVGVTPFVAWAETLADTAEPVHLFYCVRNRAGAPHLDLLESLAANKANLTLHLIESEMVGRLSGDKIAEVVDREQLRKSHVAFCGPKDMRQSLKRQLVSFGVRGSRFRYEEFEIRSVSGACTPS